MRNPSRLAHRALLLLPLALAGCGGGDARPPKLVDPVGHTLTWRETAGRGRERFVFSVSRIAIASGHWTVVGSVKNASSQPFRISVPHRPHELVFGVVPLRTSRLEELETYDRERRPLPIRRATIFEPKLPALLAPGQAWVGTMRGFGTLPRAGYLRVVFGTFVAAGSVPAGLRSHLTWITDHSLALDQKVTLELRWKERDGPIEIDVERMVFGRGSWSVDLGIVNRGNVTYVVDRPHVPDGARFGLVATAQPELPRSDRPPPYIVASTIRPPPPRRLRPGEGWRGRISGTEDLAAGTFVHVIVGRFRNGRTAFMAVTDAWTHLP